MPASTNNATVTPLELLVRQDNRPTESDDIERLLSSTFYPGAHTSYTHNDTSPPYPPVFYDHNGDSPEQPEGEPESREADKTRKKKKTTPTQSKTAGAKRKSDASDEAPGERRRKQIREAQRAYRQRKISQTAYLEERVKQLEGAIENMSSVMLSFSEELIGSNILSSQSDLTTRLRDALATCLTLVRETGSNAMEEEEESTDDSERSAAQSMAVVAVVPSIPPVLPPKPLGIRSIFGNKPYPDMNTSMTVAAFMDMVATSVVYYGYLALANPTLSPARLYRHFGLPLQLMDRDKLLSYFSALFQMRLSRSTQDASGSASSFPGKPGMPFFSIGGAGTHYSPVLAATGAADTRPLSLPWANPADQCTTWSPRNNAWTVKMDTSNVPADFQERFEGDWFDMQDLELFLREKGVSLRMKPNKEFNGDVNVPLFLRGLMMNTTCLGQSPGFRRRDVETALQAAKGGTPPQTAQCRMPV